MEALNQDLRSLRVVSVQRHLCASASEPGWAICVEYLEDRTSGRNKDDDDKRVDYREVLDAESFKVFSALRSWRKATAEKESIPVYTILTNEQLAEVARRRCASLSELEAIDGIGAARVKKYGPALLSRWRAEIEKWLASVLKLQLKAGTRLDRTSSGMEFLGFRLLPGAVLLGRRARRRFRKRLAEYEGQWLSGTMKSGDLQRRVGSLLAHTDNARCRKWRSVVVAESILAHEELV